LRRQDGPEVTSGQCIKTSREQLRTYNKGVNTVAGHPFKIHELEDALRAHLEAAQ